MAAQLVPDFRLPWPRQREAWAAIREVRTRSVLADVAAVEVALHGERGHYTQHLRPALSRLSGLDATPPGPTDRGHDPDAERAAASLLSDTKAATGPNTEMVRRVLDATDRQGTATPSAVVGLEDVWASTHRQLRALASAEALRVIEAMAAGADPGLLADGPADPSDWAQFVNRLDAEHEGVSLQAVYLSLIEGASPGLLVGAVRMAGEFRPEWLGIKASGRKSRAAFVAAVTPLSLTLGQIAITTHAGQTHSKPG